MANNSPKVLQPTVVPRPEEVLADRYDRLCEWALGLTRGDASAALEAVHDLYVYVTLAKPDFSRVENLDNYLYKCLRHIHIAHLSESSRRALHQVPVTDLDSLQFVLWSTSDSYLLEHQNELRRACRYAVWRKEQSKSASFFVLRFFLGYQLHEVSEITNLSMAVIQPKLSRMRSEIRDYLEHPESARFLAAPASDCSWLPLSSPDFFREMRAAIMGANSGECPDAEDLLAHYSALVPKPISCSLLSHLVSCERCLSIVDRHFRRPTLRDREPMDGFASAARRSFEKAGDTMSSPGHTEMLQIALRHRRDVYDHRPRTLSIAVDGKVIATHRVQGQRSTQSAYIERPDQIGCVEVFTDQDVRFAMVLLEDLPPQGPSSKLQRVELSDGRWMEIRLVFDSRGLNSEVTYFDPILGLDHEESALEDAESLTWRLVQPSVSGLLKPDDPLAASHSKSETPRRKQNDAAPRFDLLSWLRRLSKTIHMSLPDMNPLLASAMILAVASLACLIVWVYRLPRIAPTALLDQAAKWDPGAVDNPQPGVIYQKVRITAGKHVLEHAIYRDAQGRRRPRQSKLSSEDEQLRRRLEAAGVNWDAPLSARGYRNWHDGQRIQSDRVARSGDNLLTLTTVSDAPNAVVVRESLTVREGDFHPVGRSIELRDYGTVEIAELNYDVLPWSMANPDWFEPSAANTLSRRPSIHTPVPIYAGMPLSDAELDQAELSARLVLNRLQLDMGRHIEIVRSRDGVHVIGVVDDANQKKQIQAQLAMVPHILSAISTVQELDSSSNPAPISSVQAASVTTSAASSVERYIAEKGMDRSAALPLTRSLVDNSFVANHESKIIADLVQRFGASRTLTWDARMALSELIIHHKATLLSALQEEQQGLADLKLISGVSPVSVPVQGDPGALEAVAQRNFSLCVALTTEDGSQRPAQEIAPQLAEQIARMRAIVLRISAASIVSPHAPSQAEAETQEK